MPEAITDGRFFHGTVADLGIGELLTAGRRSNYRPDIVMNHVYFTALIDGAGLAAEIAAELAGGSPRPRVYAVEPTGTFENDPNMTDKNFPVIQCARTAVAPRCGFLVRSPSGRA